MGLHLTWAPGANLPDLNLPGLQTRGTILHTEITEWKRVKVKDSQVKDPKFQQTGSHHLGDPQAHRHAREPNR